MQKTTGDKMQKTTKVYRVHTGMLDAKDDVQNFSAYNLTAVDAEEAIMRTKSAFKLAKTEYIEWVELLVTLDE